MKLNLLFLFAGTLAAQCPAPTITAAVSPPSLTLIQGGTATYAVTFTAANLISSVTPSISGVPAGVTATFSPALIGNTGGSTTLTVTSDATVGAGSYSLSIGGAAPGSSATTSPVTATLATTYPANLLQRTLITAMPGAVFTIPTSFVDWRMFNTSPNEHKAGVATPLIAAASQYGSCGDGPYYFNQNDNTSLSWTNGALSASGTNNSGFYTGGGCAPQDGPITIPDTNVHEVRVYSSLPGFYGGSYVFTVHLADNSSPDLVITDAGSGGAPSELHETRILVRTPTAGGTALSFKVSGSGSYGLLKGVAVAY